MKVNSLDEGLKRNHTNGYLCSSHSPSPASSSALTNGFALPQAEHTALGESHLSRRADGWTMVLYNEHKDGGQCGGTSTTASGGGGVCRSIAGKYCADLKVALNAGIASCTFSFVKNGDCNSGTIESTTTVAAGQGSNGVDLSDQVQFVEVGCNLD